MPQTYTLEIDGRSFDLEWDRPSPPTKQDVETIVGQYRDRSARAGMDAGRLATVQRTRAMPPTRPVQAAPPPPPPTLNVQPFTMPTVAQPTVPGLKTPGQVIAERKPSPFDVPSVANVPSAAEQAATAAATGDISTVKRLLPEVLKDEQRRSSSYTLLGSRALGRTGQFLRSDINNAMHAAAVPSGPDAPVYRGIGGSAAPPTVDNPAFTAYSQFLKSLPFNQQMALVAALNEAMPGAGDNPVQALMELNRAVQGNPVDQVIYGASALAGQTTPLDMAAGLVGPAAGTVRALRGAGTGIATTEQIALAQRTEAAVNLLKQVANTAANLGIAGQTVAGAKEALDSDMPWASLPGLALGAHAGFHGVRGVRELPQGVRTLRGANKTVQGIRAEAAMGGPEGAAANAKRVWKDLVTEIHPDVVPEPLRGVANDLTAEANAVIRGKGKATEKIEKLGEIRGRWEEANRNGVSEGVRPGGVQNAPEPVTETNGRGASTTKAPADSVDRVPVVAEPQVPTTGIEHPVTPSGVGGVRPPANIQAETSVTTAPTRPPAETAPPAPTEAPVPPTNTVRGVRGSGELVTPESQVGERKPTDAVQIGSAEAQVPGAPQGRQDQPGNGGGVRPSQPGNVAANPSGEAGPVEAQAPAQVDDGHSRLIQRVYEKLKAGESLGNVTELNKLAEEAFGSSRVSGEWTPKDAFDAMEAGVNKYLIEHGKDLMDAPAHEGLARLRELMGRITSQGIRTKEQIQNQQFSTPPTESYVAAKVAGLKSGDVVLEPSAGNGGLVVWPKAMGATVHVNEIAERRQKMLEAIGFGKPTGHDAEYINALLDEGVKPTVVLMNPPFSASTQKSGEAKNRNLYGFNHVDQALQRLADGGRLVAILGGGKANDLDGGASLTSVSSGEWFKRLATQYNIRANVRIHGREYQKYGTSFATRLIVIDKNGPTQDMGAVVRGNFDTLEEAYDALKGVEQTRPVAQSPGAGSPEGNRPAAGGGSVEPRPGSGGGRPGAAGTSAGDTRRGELSPRPDSAPDGTARVPAGDGAQQPPLQQPGPRPVAPAGEPASAPGVGSPRQDADNERQASIELEANAKTKAEEEDTSAFVTYQPSIKGKEHPGVIVETKAMSTVPLPPVTYKPSLPKKALDYLSAIQLEPIALAGQQNEIVLPSGHRGSMLIGDGTGVGKGSIAAGILFDNWNKGRKRLVWVSENWPLMQDAIRDLTAVGAEDLAKSIKPLTKFKTGTPIEHEGVLFVTYSLIRSVDKNGNARSADIMNYLRGSDNAEGAYILFDESHNLKNAVVGRGPGKPSQVGVAVKKLMNDIPNLRSVSLSATAASDVMNLGYLDRLGLWGPGTSFRDFTEFTGEIARGGMAAMEMIARELKAQGKYVSRSLSYRGVTYSEHEHKVTPEQKEIYRQAARAWRIVNERVGETIKNVTNGGSRQRSLFMSQYYSSQQRFFNLLLSTFKIPTTVELANAALARGESVVITLINTNEAAQNREKLKVLDEEEEIPDFDFGPAEMLIRLVEDNFPVQQYMDDVTEDGRPVKTPMTNADGSPRLNPTAVRARDELVAQLKRDLNMPANPLDILMEALGGPNKVAELTGRKERYDANTGKFVPRAGQGVAAKDVNKAEEAAFQGGKKRIAILSQAAGTGITLSSSLAAKNQQKRFHITHQVGWSADKAMQMFGRTHRTNQRTPPEYAMPKTDLGGEARFISTIGRRLGQMEALSKGQTNTSEATENMAKVNFETDQGKQAARTFYSRLEANATIPGTDMTGFDVLRELGVLRGAEGQEAVPEADKTNVTRLLNRLLALDPDVQNAVYDFFYDIFAATVKQAEEDGTLDTGVQTIPGDRFEIKEERVLARDPTTGAETFYYPVHAQVKTNRVTVQELQRRMKTYADSNPRILRNSKGKLHLVVDTRPIVHADGTTTDAVYVATPHNGTWKKMAASDVARYVDVAKYGNDRAAQLGQQVENEKRNLESYRKVAEKATGYNADWYKRQVPVLEQKVADLERRLAEANTPSETTPEELWQKQYEEAPEHETVQYSLVGGAVMRYWAAIRSAAPFPLRILTAVDSKTGKRIVGVALRPEAVENLISRITGQRGLVTTSRLISDVMDHGLTYTLEGGTQVKQGRVAGYRVLRLVPGSDSIANRLRDMGVAWERGMFPVYYVPEDGRAEKVAAILKEFPVVFDEQTADDEYAAPMRDLGAPSAPASGTPPRIPVAPKQGGRPRKLRDIIDRFAMGLGKSIHYGRAKRGAAGLYSAPNANIQIRFRGDLDTVGHEMAHYLDDAFGIVAEWAKPRMRSPFDEELSQYWMYGSVTSRSTLAHKRAEGVAEFLRAYVMNPGEVQFRSNQHPYPFIGYLEEKLPPEVWKAIQQFSDDVREWAGLSAEQRTLSNIRTEAPRTTAGDAVEPLRARERADRSFETTPRDKLLAAVTDELWPVEKARNRAAEIRDMDLPPSQDPAILMRLWHGFNEKFEEIFQHGLVDADGNRVTPGGIRWLLEPLDKSSFTTLKSDFDGLMAYLVSERVMEKGEKILAQAEQRIKEMDPKDPLYKAKADKLRNAARAQVSRLSGTGGGIESDFGQAAETVMDIRMNPERHKRIGEAANRYRAWADGVLRYWVEKGRLSEADYERIKADNEHYAAMNRLMEEDAPLLNRKSAANRLGSIGARLQRFRGSTRMIENPFASLMTQTFKMMREADRNEVLQRFTHLLIGDRSMYEGDVEHLSDIGYRVKQGGPNTITVFRNGKAEHWRFEEGVYQSLKGWGQIADSNLFTWMAGVLRAGVTASPSFRVRNFIRDTQERSILSEAGSTPLDVFRPAKKGQRSEAVLAGAGQAGHYLTDPEKHLRLLRDEMTRLSKDPRTVLLVPRYMMRWWNKVGESGELRNRMAEYRRAYDHGVTNLGYSDKDARLYAAAQARALLDFARGGRVTKRLNQYIPFLNAKVQGMSRVGRAWRQRPGATFAKWFLYALLPGLAVYLWNRKRNALEELHEQPDYLQDMFYNVKVDDNLWLRVPRAHEMGVAAAGVERLIDYGLGNEKAFDGYLGSALRATLPVDDATVFLGPFRAEFENIANYDYFRNRTVIPDYENDLALPLRPNAASGSRLGQLIGGPLDVDPRKVDHAIEGHFGHMGRLAANLSNIGREDRPQARAFGLNDFTGLFTASPGSQAKSVQEALSTAKAAGLSNDRQVVRLRGKLKRLYAAKTDADRDDAAADAREYAASILPRLKERAENAYERGPKVKR